MAGWFAVKRGLLEHELFAPVGPFSRAEAWLWMIGNTPYQDGEVVIRGKKHPTKRGHLYHSIRFMARKFRWSEKAVRSFIDKLEMNGAVERVGAQKGAHFGAHLRLCNFDKYQLGGHTSGHRKRHKEEQDKQVPVGATPSASPKEAVWTTGKPFLASRGVTNPGEMIGRWLKTASAGEVLDAITAADRAGTHDPITYIGKVLGNRKREPKPGDRRTTPDGRVQEFAGGIDGWMDVYQ